MRGAKIGKGEGGFRLQHNTVSSDPTHNTRGKSQ